MGLKPEEDLRAHLVTALSLTAGEDAVDGPVQPPDDTIKAKAVFIIPDGGETPDAYAGGATAEALRKARLVLHCRGDKDQFTAGLAFARSIRDSANYASLTGYLKEGVIVQQTEPNWLGYDQDNHPEWTVNVVMEFEE